MGIKASHLLVPALLLLCAANAGAAEIHGRSSTQFESFINQFNDERQIELGQYLRLGVTNIDSEGKFSVYGYGRVTQDLTNGEGLNGRLYYLYGEYLGFKDKVDLRVGRQFVNVAAGSAIIDGLQAELKNVGPVGFTVFSGRDVVFGLNGEIGSGWNTDLGVSAYLAGFRQTDAELSWFRKWQNSDVARDFLGASFKQYLLNNLRVYGNTRFDLTSEVFSEVQGGVKYYPLSNLIFTGEYYQSYPSFDTTSIFSVFAVNRYSEGVFNAEYIFNEMVAGNIGYSHQDYGNDATANVYHAGVRLHPIDRLGVNLEYDRRYGFGGHLNGGMIDADYQISKQLNVAGGITHDVFQRDAMTSEEIASRYWIGGKYKIAQNLSVSGRIETNVNAQFSHNTSSRATLDYDF